ncbi:MAG: hypothetical protein P8X79_22395 [Reinekea sp.]
MIPLCFPKISVNLCVPATFEKQIEIKLLHPASTEGVTDSDRKQKKRPKTL